MQILDLSLRQEYFDAIKLGRKTVEGRLNTHKFKELQLGMKIRFTSPQTDEVIMCTVEAIRTYTNFEDMLQHEGIDNMLPDVTTIKQGVTLYESFPCYKNDVKKLGAIAIKIKMITP